MARRQGNYRPRPAPIPRPATIARRAAKLRAKRLAAMGDDPEDANRPLTYIPSKREAEPPARFFGHNRREIRLDTDDSL